MSTGNDIEIEGLRIPLKYIANTYVNTWCNLHLKYVFKHFISKVFKYKYKYFLKVF